MARVNQKLPSREQLRGYSGCVHMVYAVGFQGHFGQQSRRTNPVVRAFLDVLIETLYPPNISTCKAPRTL